MQCPYVPEWRQRWSALGVEKGGAGAEESKQEKSNLQIVFKGCALPTNLKSHKKSRGKVERVMGSAVDEVAPAQQKKSATGDRVNERDDELSNSVARRRLYNAT